MRALTRLPVEWRLRESPRSPVAALAQGAGVAELAESIARRLAAGASIRAASGGGALLALAEPDDLPWAHGLTFLGWEDDVLLPTTLDPSVPVAMVAAASRQLVRASAGRAPTPAARLVLVPSRVLVVDRTDLALSPEGLALWAAALR